MNRVWKLLLTLTFTILLVNVASTPVVAAEGNPVAEEFVDPGGILFIPVTTFKEIELIVSYPNGQVAKRTFEGGDKPRFDLSASWCPKVSDGLYTYELRAIFNVNPDEEIRYGECEGKLPNGAVVQNGYFYVDRGRIVSREEQEEGGKKQSASSGSQSSTGTSSLPGQEISGANKEISSTQDICYNDDLIVDGSLCVGFDCTCNYSFGFDTIVLKENNLRIFFDDTSVAASFPRNDWRIVINDSANGGASYFGVEDSTGGRRVFTLEAGAPSHSLYIDDGGRAGFGTSTPSVELHTVDGDTPTLRLQQDGSSGFAPQTWDVAGNETNFFIRDVTNGSTLPFRIQPDTPSSTLTMRSSGNVGIGTWSPNAPLHLLTDSSTDAEFRAERTSGSTLEFSAKSSRVTMGSASNHEVRFSSNGTGRLGISATGNVHVGTSNIGTYSHLFEVDNGVDSVAYTDGGAWVNGSSRASKDNIKDLTTKGAMETLKALNPVRFNYKFNDKEEYLGFIAEDVPELVATEDRKGLAAMDIVAVLTKVLQEQQKTITQLKKEVSELKKKIK
jgi:hypothetical protein